MITWRKNTNEYNNMQKQVRGSFATGGFVLNLSFGFKLYSLWQVLKLLYISTPFSVKGNDHLPTSKPLSGENQKIHTAS